jgi:hypothetical protein
LKRRSVLKTPNSYSLLKQRRFRKGKESLFLLHGRKVTSAKIDQWIARKAFSKEEIENLETGAGESRLISKFCEYSLLLAALTPVYIRLQTPEPDGSTTASAKEATLIDTAKKSHSTIHSTILQREPNREEAFTTSLATSAERSFAVTS